MNQADYSFSQNLIIGLKGPWLTEEEKKWIQQNNTFAFVLYRRNIIHSEQLSSLVKEIQSLHIAHHGHPTLLSIDMEGGPLHELPAEKFQYFPSGPELISNTKNDAELFKAGYKLGAYLQQQGFHINYAPVLDVLTHSGNQLLKKLSWGQDPRDVIQHSKPYIQGMQDAGILAVAKHFPGHGHTQIDSHEALPIDPRSLMEIDTLDLPPFLAAYATGVHLFMTAHVLYPAIDPERPATLSPYLLTDWTQKKWKLPGFFIADDLDMGALRSFGNSHAILQQSIEAGGHFFMYCHRADPPWSEWEFANQFLHNSRQAYWKRLHQAYKQIHGLIFSIKNKLG